MDWKLSNAEERPVLTSTGNQKSEVCGHSSRDSLPKLYLHKFDGDPLHWPDCRSMFK